MGVNERAKRVEILAQVDDGNIGVTTAANLMNMSRRHVYRLLDRFLSEGPGGIRHRARGRRPNNAIHPAKREYAMTLVRERYEDFGPTLASEMLLHHGFKVGQETLRQDGLWLSRKQRRRFNQPRLRRECFGELVQIDGSEHRWFEDRGDPCALVYDKDQRVSHTAITENKRRGRRPPGRPSAIDDPDYIAQGRKYRLRIEVAE